MKPKWVKDLPEDFPFTIGTLYQWHHHNRYPGVLIKVAGKLCVDMDRIGELVVSKEEKAA